LVGCPRGAFVFVFSWMVWLIIGAIGRPCVRLSLREWTQPLPFLNEDANSLNADSVTSIPGV
jgi:hypothetical protein